MHGNNEIIQGQVGGMSSGTLKTQAQLWWETEVHTMEILLTLAFIIFIKRFYQKRTTTSKDQDLGMLGGSVS